MMKLGLSDVSPAIVFGRPAIDTAWLGPAQRRAIAFVLEARKRANSAMLIGPRACGKSIVLDQILAAAEPARFFRISDSWESGRSLLLALLESAGLAGADLGEVHQRNLLQTHLDFELRNGRPVLFAIDDADRLSAEVWRELLRIGSMPVADGRPFMLFVGRQETAGHLERIDPPAWGALKSRVHEMSPPTSIDCGAYIEHRLNIAGADVSIFPVAARLMVGKLASGSFVRVNLLAQAAMLLARQRGCVRLTEELVVEANRTMAAAAAERVARPDLPRSRPAGRDRSAGGSDARARFRVVPSADPR